MRAAARVLREIAPGIVTTVIVEPDQQLAGGDDPHGDAGPA